MSLLPSICHAVCTHNPMDRLAEYEYRRRGGASTIRTIRINWDLVKTCGAPRRLYVSLMAHELVHWMQESARLELDELWPTRIEWALHRVLSLNNTNVQPFVIRWPWEKDSS